MAQIPRLKIMSLFAKTFSNDEILSQPVIKISWSSLIEIMNKSSSEEEMLWYAIF